MFVKYDNFLVSPRRERQGGILATETNISKDGNHFFEMEKRMYLTVCLEKFAYTLSGNVSLT